MATTKTDAQKVAELRKQAMDKSLPQEVRDMADKKANEIEGKSVEKATGMKLAKGGSVKKMMYGGMAEKPMMANGGAVKKMAVGGSLEQMQQAMMALKQPQKKPQKT